MVRVEDHNITFFHLPKNAGSSIATWLTKNVNGEEYIDEFRHSTPQRLLPIFQDFGWSFCCVRNPWDRFVSWYNFFKKQGKITIDFDDFIEKVINKEYSAKYITAPSDQSKFVKDVQYVIRYENLNEDFKVIQERTNCFKPLPHTNKSVDFKYKEYYTKDSWINYIGDYCKEEIYLLGYKFGE
jgi:hypothetical protein